MHFNKLEKYILNRLGIEKFQKLCLRIEQWLYKYKNYKICTQLQTIRDEGIEAFPESHRDMAKILLDNEIKSLLSPLNKLNTIEQMSVILYSTISAIHAYKLLSNIIGVQPIQAPVGLVYLLQRVDDMSFEINAIPTDAKRIKLNTTMPIELVNESLTMHGVNVQYELGKALGVNFGAEIVDNTINSIVSIATETKVDYIPEKDADLFQLALTAFNDAAINITNQTGRGHSFFIIMSPDTFSRIGLSSSDYWEMEKQEVEPLDAYGLTLAGTLSKKYAVYLSSNATFTTGKVLIGAANNISARNIDTGIVLAPYIPVIPSGVIMDGNTFEPVIGFSNRSGIVYNNDMKNEKKYQKSENYYQIIDIS